MVLPAIEQVRHLIAEAQTGSDLRALWGRIRALPTREQQLVKDAYLCRKEELDADRQ